MPQLPYDAHFLFLLVLQKYVLADYEYGYAEPHRENFDDEIKHHTFVFVYSCDTNDDVDENHCGNRRRDDVFRRILVLVYEIFSVEYERKSDLRAEMHREKD